MDSANALYRWASGICRGISDVLIPNHHRVIDISINTSIGPSCTWRLSDLPNGGSRRRTAGCSLMSMPRTHVKNPIWKPINSLIDWHLVIIPEHFEGVVHQKLSLCTPPSPCPTSSILKILSRPPPLLPIHGRPDRIACKFPKRSLKKHLRAIRYGCSWAGVGGGAGACC